ncbi:MAG: helix-turn-helix domain-containing protein [Bacteroidales bacterium]|nr:helix-turn-helix domain-containing protein [Bacteroidales bacterium]
MKRLPLILFVLIVAACSRGTGGGAKRLPDLPEPLSSPHVMALNGELTIFGGHTDGFLLSPSAWYLKDGTWHKVPMKYPHDYSFCSLMPDGRVMLGGGSADAFGIGQSWGVEIYDPATHSFTAVGVLDRKRAGASALAFPDGRVLVSGNWYAPDAMEIYKPGEGFSFLKETSVQRSIPFILATAADNAIVFSGQDNYGNPSDGTVDRLSGEPFHEPLLDEWEVWCTKFADLSIGEYSYLVLSRHRENKEWGILKIEGENFSLLETDRPLPAFSDAGSYLLWHQLAVDRSRRSAYTVGIDTEGNACMACINYDPVFDGGKAEVTLTVFSGPIPIADSFALLPDGTFVCAGGAGVLSVDSIPTGNNFIMTREVWAFPTGAPIKAGFPWSWFLVAGFLVLTAGAFLLSRRNVHNAKAAEAEDLPVTRQMTEQLCQIIEEEELFKQQDLRITDIAARLATNRTYVSAIIKSLSGENFSNLINSYRIRYAQKLMKEHPEMNITEIAEECGFSSRSAFYRNFKDITGQSPTEWKRTVV